MVLAEGGGVHEGRPVAAEVALVRVRPRPHQQLRPPDCSCLHSAAFTSLEMERDSGRRGRRGA